VCEKEATEICKARTEWKIIH